MQLSIHISFLLYVWKICAPEVFQINQSWNRNIIRDVAKGATTEERISTPNWTWCDVRPEVPVCGVVIMDRNLVKIGPLYALQSLIFSQLRKSFLGLLVVVHRGGSGIVPAFDIREEVESPEELKKCVGLTFPIKQFGVDDPATVPTKEATRITEEDDGEGKYSKLGSMEFRRVGKQLTADFISSVPPLDMTLQVLAPFLVLLQLRQCAK
jgi:hypothetical protein